MFAADLETMENSNAVAEARIAEGCGSFLYFTSSLTTTGKRVDPTTPRYTNTVN